MRSITSTKFRKHISSILDEVEGGERVLISRHGKVIATVMPASKPSERPAWKRHGPRISTAGAALSAAVLRERNR